MISDSNVSERAQMVPMEANSDQHITPCGDQSDGIIPMRGSTTTTRGHYKQTASNSILNVSMDEFAVKDAESDMQILGDDEFDVNAIVTKQPTFEDAENDEEIINEEEMMSYKRRTKKSTLNIEGRRYKKSTMINDIGDGDMDITQPDNDEQDEEYDEYEEDEYEEDDDDVILTIGFGNKKTIGGSMDITETIQ